MLLRRALIGNISSNATSLAGNGPLCSEPVAGVAACPGRYPPLRRYRLVTHVGLSLLVLGRLTQYQAAF